MAGHHQRFSPCRLINGLQADCFGLRVQSGQRLVQHQHIAVVAQRPCQGHAALHAAGEPVRFVVCRLTQTQPPKHGAGRRVIGKQGHILRRRFPRQQAVFLKHGGKAQSLGTCDAALAGFFQPHQQAQHRGLTAAGGRPKAKPRAVGDCQAHILQHIPARTVAKIHGIKPNHDLRLPSSSPWPAPAARRCTGRSPASGQIPRRNPPRSSPPTAGCRGTSRCGR